ncbi:hypothetical protein GTP58_03790 [Duganella sp. CY15W]|uniref:hypothetical protein n=1 Tax=Duganella sp. CY15W TaxID=2692172 RepID=UPI001371B82F|nr:hypothetical protein [Duganella sp. CY15W]MYM27438.1 hypothetical protein [Duganella sp. CY15W]
MRTEQFFKLKEDLGQPLFQLYPDATIIDDDLAEVVDNLFVTLSQHEAENSEYPRMDALLWAVSRGAAMRSFNLKISEDDGQLGIPPDCVLPANSKRYSEIIGNLKLSGTYYSETASYRIMKDGAFVHKTIQTRGVIYYFRSQTVSNNEVPYAILQSNV